MEESHVCSKCCEDVWAYVHGIPYCEYHWKKVEKKKADKRAEKTRKFYAATKPVYDMMNAETAEQRQAIYQQHKEVIDAYYAALYK